MAERKKVGLALGSGGAKGMAHIGVLKVLEKYNIPIDMIAGTSMGAVIAAMYASNPNAKKLQKEVLDMDWSHIFDYTISKKGLVKGDRIEQLLEEKLGCVKFNQLKIPLYVTSYDIEKNQEVVFTKGDVGRAVRASISIPGVFIPVENKKRVLVDGGIIDPIPTEVLKKSGAEVIIAVNVNVVKEKKLVIGEKTDGKHSKDVPNIIHTVVKSLQVIEAEASRADLEKTKADLIINIDLEELGPLDFSKNMESIKKGERAAVKSLKEIEMLTEPNLFKNFLDELESLGISHLIKKLEKVGKELEKE